MTQSREATLDDGATSAHDAHEEELTSLVRRWVSAGRQERLRRDSVLRVAPSLDDAPAAGSAEVGVRPVASELAGFVKREEAEPEWIESLMSYAGSAAVDAPASAPAAEQVIEHAAEQVADPVPPSAAASSVDASAVQPTFQAPAPRTPPLPHRPSMEETEHARRIAVLIDARRVEDDVAAGLLARLGERGTVNVCRAYADWSRSDLGAWVGRMRRQGLHSFHQFADDDDQALVAMAIDAVDIARDAAIDEIVIAGDMTSMLPLVHRLHAAGVRVVLVGAGHTPHDVRGACDEFIDTAQVGTHQVAPVGRHRA